MNNKKILFPITLVLLTLSCFASNTIVAAANEPIGSCNLIVECDESPIIDDNSAPPFLPAYPHNCVIASDNDCNEFVDADTIGNIDISNNNMNTRFNINVTNTTTVNELINKTGINMNISISELVKNSNVSFNKSLDNLSLDNLTLSDLLSNVTVANATIGEINTTLANVINNTNSTPEKEDDGGFVPGLHFGPDSNSISFNEAIPIDDYDDGGVPTWLTVTGIVIVAIGALFGIGSIGIFACI